MPKYAVRIVETVAYNIEVTADDDVESAEAAAIEGLINDDAVHRFFEGVTDRQATHCEEIK